jgi:hypothetical protein
VGRRNAGEGSLYQRKDGSWVAQSKGKYKYAKDKGKRPKPSYTQC